ncbi:MULTISPECIES: MFS transporter [unclassified Beijerinckia]|uniref:MFS transporter n=1 Tax=unclassified Beijerinckia TaxID=2638183 RepID=UPI00089670F8|nr:MULTISPECIES: MFS transporter [unclassified Beijerinckia]MDH7795149.1 MFS family permease [Beijerinckia sp. GAS462]SEB89617.1 Predicted arabinose efflux permease, MFS family [Beijerinckia sp. 28-YEA-48]
MERQSGAGTNSVGSDHAWLVLLGAGLCMFCGQAATMLFTFGVFAPEIATATGWLPVTIAAAIGPATIAGALLAPIAGRAADAFGVRRMVLIGGPAYAVGFVMLGLLPHDPVQFIALLALVSALGFAATPVLYAQLATLWFARRRGLALSLIFACTSLGVAFWPPLAAKLIDLYGWRIAYMTLGTAAGSVILLSALFLLRDPLTMTPSVAPSGSHAIAPGMSLPEALRGGTFWVLMAVFVILTGVMAGIIVNLPVILRQLGVPPLSAASVMAVVGAAMFIGRLSAGLMLDRWFSPYVTAAFTLLPIAGLAALLVDLSPTTLYLAAVFLGLGLGSEMDAAAYIVSRAFGVRWFGAIYGVITLSYGLSSAIGPAMTGAALSSGISPHTVFAIGLAMLVPALLLLLSLRRRHLPFSVDVLVETDRLAEVR